MMAIEIKHVYIISHWCYRGVKYPIPRWVKGWTHDEIVAGNVAEVEWKSTPETLQATLRATVSEAVTSCNYPTARNIACNVASCGRVFRQHQKTKRHVGEGSRWCEFKTNKLSGYSRHLLCDSGVWVRSLLKLVHIGSVFFPAQFGCSLACPSSPNLRSWSQISCKSSNVGTRGILYVNFSTLFSPPSTLFLMFSWRNQFPATPCPLQVMLPCLMNGQPKMWICKQSEKLAKPTFSNP